MVPNYFRFVKQSIPPPGPGQWTEFTLQNQPQFNPTYDAAYPTITKFAHGGYFDDDIVALRTMNPHVGKNYSEFSIFERVDDTWTKNFHVTGSDVTAAAGNGAWFLSNEQVSSGTNGYDHHIRSIDKSTTYDSSTKTMYVLAATSSDNNDRMGLRNHPWQNHSTPLFKTQKTDGSWPALTEVGIMPKAGLTGNGGSFQGRSIHYMKNDDTLATMTTLDAIHFTNPATLEIVDSVAWTRYDPSGANNAINNWGSYWGTNVSKTKVWAGGIMENVPGTYPTPNGYRYMAVQIISSGSSDGWELEGTITGSTDEHEGYSIQHHQDRSFHFNDDYAVLGMPKANRQTTDWGGATGAPGASNFMKRTGCVRIYKKTGATWADHELVQTVEASASYVGTGIAETYNMNFGHGNWQHEMGFGNSVRINDNNDIVIVAPHFYDNNFMAYKAGLVLFLTKSSDADAWGMNEFHTGSVASQNVGNHTYPISDTMFQVRHLGTDRAIVSAPSGSRTYQGFETFKKEEN
jgi:hypothetical protein